MLGRQMLLLLLLFNASALLSECFLEAAFLVVLLAVSVSLLFLSFSIFFF